MNFVTIRNWSDVEITTLSDGSITVEITNADSEGRKTTHVAGFPNQDSLLKEKTNDQNVFNYVNNPSDKNFDLLSDFQKKDVLSQVLYDSMSTSEPKYSLNYFNHAFNKINLMTQEIRSTIAERILDIVIARPDFDHETLTGFVSMIIENNSNDTKLHDRFCRLVDSITSRTYDLNEVKNRALTLTALERLTRLSRHFDIENIECPMLVRENDVFVIHTKNFLQKVNEFQNQSQLPVTKTKKSEAGQTDINRSVCSKRDFEATLKPYMAVALSRNKLLSQYFFEKNLSCQLFGELKKLSDKKFELIFRPYNLDTNLIVISFDVNFAPNMDRSKPLPNYVYEFYNRKMKQSR